MIFNSRRFSHPLIAMSLGAMVLSGCNEQILLAPGAVDANDSCGQYATRISQARQTEIDRQIQNAAAGAVVGALLGAALSSGEDRLKGAVIGAAAGGLTGYAGTYLQQKQANAKDANALLASVNGDAAQEMTLVTGTGKAVAELRKCRADQVAALSKNIRSGKVDKVAGRKELAQLQKRIAVDNKIVSATFNGIGKRVDVYVDAASAVTSVSRAEMVAASNAKARKAPAVSRVSAGSKSMIAQDEKASLALKNSISSIEKLLG